VSISADEWSNAIDEIISTAAVVLSLKFLPVASVPQHNVVVPVAQDGVGQQSVLYLEHRLLQDGLEQLLYPCRVGQL
jgi:hypothetical protein